MKYDQANLTDLINRPVTSCVSLAGKMNVCKPPLIWIDGCCYRKNPYILADDDQGLIGDTQDMYEEDDQPQNPDPREDDEAENFEVEELPNGRFRASIHIASAYFAIIIGKKGATKKRIELDTKTQISIPRMGADESSNVIITGNRKGNVLSACNRVTLFAQAARNRQSFTHFVSIPLNSKKIQESFREFKMDVLRECRGARGIDETIFQDPALLHLTICTLALMDSHERHQATEVLQDCREHAILPILGEKPLEVEVSGLEIMNDDQAEVDVLYAKVRPVNLSDGEDILQKLSDQIVDKFVESGLVSRQYDRVKLHMTVMNSIFRQEREGILDDEKPSGRETFDSRPIFKKFCDYNFGRIQISEMHLSQRRSSKRGVGEYYAPSVIITFTECA